MQSKDIGKFILGAVLIILGILWLINSANWLNATDIDPGTKPYFSYSGAIIAIGAGIFVIIKSIVAISKE